MKKLLSVILLFSLCLSLGACASKNADNKPTPKPENASSATKESGDFLYEELNDGVVITFLKTNPKGKTLKVPGELGGKPVIGIGFRTKQTAVFANAVDVQEVILPDSIKYIGVDAFVNMDKLYTVTGGKNITQVFGNAFYSCEKLETVSFLESVEWISKNAFRETPLANKVDKLRDTKMMADPVCDFPEAYEYTSYFFGSVITKFHNDAMDEFSQIVIPVAFDEKPVIGIGNKETEQKVFTDIYGSECEVILPTTLQYIGNSAFAGAIGLSKISGGNNLKEIDSNAFLGCDNLTSMEHLDTIATIASDAFYRSGLEDKIPEPQTQATESQPQITDAQVTEQNTQVTQVTESQTRQ